MSFCQVRKTSAGTGEGRRGPWVTALLRLSQGASKDRVWLAASWRLELREAGAAKQPQLES